MSEERDEYEVVDGTKVTSSVTKDGKHVYEAETKQGTKRTKQINANGSSNERIETADGEVVSFDNNKSANQANLDILIQQTRDLER